MNIRHLVHFFAATFASAAFAASVLDQPAEPATIEKPDLPTLFYAIGQAYKVNVTVGQGVKGDGLIRFNGGTLRDLFHMVTDKNDLYLEETGTGVVITRAKTEFYYIDYPAVKRTSQATSSISLSPSSSSGSNGYSSVLQPVGNRGTPNAGVNGMGGGDATTLQVTEASAENSIWADINAELQKNLREGEYISVNTLTGIVTVEASPSRQRYWGPYIQKINERMNAQVMVELRIDQVNLNDANKRGIDWTQITTDLAGLNLGFKSGTNVTTLGANAALPDDSFVGNFSAGKLSAVIHALEQQGTVRNISVSSTRVLNNQKGYIKVGTDRTFYSVQSNIQISQGDDNPQTVTQDIYTKERQTFGTVCPVTAQVGADGMVTLVLEPARTRLDGIDVSPNGKDRDPITADQRISTMVRLRTNETALVGGLTTDDVATQTRKIPILGSLPWIGALARTDAETASSTQLLFYVTVRIIQ